MKKLFILAGELSGDNIGQWYVQRYVSENDFCEGIGGDGLQAAGVNLYKRFEELNITGFLEVIKKLPFILRCLNEVATYIINNGFTEVILIDFPGYNLRLAGMLKKRLPTIQITYVSPPQLWCWGGWRIKKLKRVCDNVVVMYPFEVEWYAVRGLKVSWLGSPVYDRMAQFIKEDIFPEKKIALLIGSRPHELERLFPLAAEVIKKLSVKFPDFIFVIPMASSISSDFFQIQLDLAGLAALKNRIKIVTDEVEKMQELATCCLALTKPGTITLELGLLGVPMIIFFKTSRLNYFLARKLVTVDAVGLPNLLLKEKVCNEFLQANCTSTQLFDEAIRIINLFEQKDPAYCTLQNKLKRLRLLLKSPKDLVPF